MTLMRDAIANVRATNPLLVAGTVGAVRGLTLFVDDLPAEVGSLVTVHARDGARSGEVVGFDSGRTIVMTLGATLGVRAGDRVTAETAAPTVGVGNSLLGRVINGLGRPVDHGPVPVDLRQVPLVPEPLGPMDRGRITTMLPTGVRAIDLMTTVGKGQRLGIFAGPGVGKSTLLGMVAKRTAADVNVIALIGERGREVREFLDEALGPEGLERSLIVVATSDEAPLMRVRAANVACAAAEFFRDLGLDVMLMVDSITRFAHAQRQIGLSVGEPPATKGFTPSVFAALPTLLERAGAVERGRGSLGGSITAFYTILVEGDDVTEPISDAVRGILDGHVMLSRTLANHGHYPAIDVLDSISRVAPAIIDEDHESARRALTGLIASYREVEELVQIGAYAEGSNPEADAAIALKPRIDELLRQGVDERAGFFNAKQSLVQLASDLDKLKQARAGEGAQRAGE